MPLDPEGAIPDCHEGDSKEKPKSSTNLGNHGGRWVKELLLLYGGVPVVPGGQGLTNVQDVNKQNTYVYV